ncbi:MAG: 3-oxoacid CoA-transferase [Eubacterium sp.]|nr:3-oxoacid CoA-transferase [Eubacterium sp.]MBQ9061820.1 3-oxoacid CoA-transferase [Eubacterium sp.]
MKKVNIISAEEAAMMVDDGVTIATGGFVSCACPEALSKALEKRFLETGHPRDLTLFFAAGQGHRDGTGGDHYGHEGLVKRVIGGHWDRAPKLGDLALANKIEAYNIPQGVVTHMYRDIAAHKVGTITHVGLNTFVDPRNEGGKLNDFTKEDIVELINIGGKELLLYKAMPIDVVFVRASYVDTLGNCTVHREIGPLDVTAMCQAAKNSGGKVIVQAEKIVEAGTLDPRLVVIPGIYVDAVVVGSEEDNLQCIGTPYDGALSGEYRIPVDAIPPIPLDAKKVLARRAAMELPNDAIVNLGTGAPEKIANVAAEEGISNKMTLTVEAGSIAGVPYGGTQFGGAANSMCIIPHNVQFDFYQGGGLDVAFLGLAETAPNGDLNVSKFGTRLAGAGGFIDITQNAKKVVYCGTFTAKGLKIHCEDGKLVIDQEGGKKKFVNKVEQITFSGDYANSVNQPVLYVTERAVFELRKDGVTLIEIAPGIDLQKDVLDQMEFMPKIEYQEDGSVKLMDARIFRDEPMGLE